MDTRRLHRMQSTAEKDPWAALMHNISDHIFNGNDNGQTEVASVRELLRNLTTSASFSKPRDICKSGSPGLSPKRHWSSEVAYSTASTFTVVPCRTEPLLTCGALADVEYAFVCAACLSEFPSVAELNYHKSVFCFSTEQSRVRAESGLSANMPNIPEPHSFYRRSLTPQTCLKLDPLCSGGVDLSRAPAVSADVLAALGLRPRYSNIAEASPGSKKLRLSLPEPLGDFGSPVRPAPLLSTKPRTPSLISQLLRSPTSKSPKRFSASFDFVGDRTTDESSCSDDDAVRECRVQLVDVMKSSRSAGNRRGYVDEDRESGLVDASRKPSSALQNSSAVSSSASTVSPRWLLGIDLSSPLGMRVTDALGLSQPPDVFSLRAAAVGSTSPAGNLSSKGSTADLQKLREREVYYPVVYKRPKKQKHVHIYHFRNRRGKLLPGFADSRSIFEVVTRHQKLRQCSVSVRRHSSLDNRIPLVGNRSVTGGTSTVVKSDTFSYTKPIIRNCCVCVSKQERELADCVLHSIMAVKCRQDDNVETPLPQAYLESLSSEQNGMPLSLQLSEDVYAELMVLRNVVRRAVLGPNHV